jgi:flagellar hook-associated protein FlgK
MSDLLAIGASGVRAYQSALSTVSENIANSGVEGYARRTTTLREVSVTSGLMSQPWRAGNGVVATGIGRAADPLKDAAVRNASADLAKTETTGTWLDRIQSSLTENRLDDRLTAFYTSATTLAADPTSLPARATMVEAAGSVASAFSATGRALDQAGADLDVTALQATGQISLLAASLAKVNEGLGRTDRNSGAAAQLADQRDTLVAQMSALTDVSMTTDELGRATVRVGGNAGATIVSNTDSGTMTYVRNSEGAVSFAVQFGASSDAVTLNGGALAGVAESAGKIQDAADALDALATSFTGSINGFQTGGSDLDGKPGVAMFTVAAGMPTEITVSMTDPRGIAAAATGGGSGDGSNLLALQESRKTTAIEGKLNTLVAQNAAQIGQRSSIADAQNAIRNGAISSRDAVSGINLDTEAVDLLRFQQAYSASSRVIQVAREAFQSILSIN